MLPNPVRRVIFVLCLLPATPVFSAETHLLGGLQSDPFFINDAVGTDVLWNAGYYGAGVVIANVEAGHPWSGHEVFDRTALGLPATPARLVNAPASADEPELGESDFHATMVAHVLVGAKTVVNPNNSISLTLAGAGMAPSPPFGLAPSPPASTRRWRTSAPSRSAIRPFAPLTLPSTKEALRAGPM